MIFYTQDLKGIPVIHLVLLFFKDYSREDYILQDELNVKVQFSEAMMAKHYSLYVT